MSAVTERPKHSKKEVEASVRYAENKGFRVEFPWGHWGGLLCPCGECPIVAVFSTPKSVDNHAKKIRRKVDQCPKAK